MTYTPTTWADDEIGATPIDAAALNNIESGVEANDTAIADLLARVIVLETP